MQGLSIFGKLLEWFQNQNNWAGWAIFLAMYTANVSLLLPGIVLILGAGFIFGYAQLHTPYLHMHNHEHVLLHNMSSSRNLFPLHELLARLQNLSIVQMG